MTRIGRYWLRQHLRRAAPAEELADQPACPLIHDFLRRGDVAGLAQFHFVGLADLGADVDLGDAALDRGQHVLALDPRAAVQHQRDARGRGQLLEVFQVQPRPGLGLILQPGGDRAVDAADRDREPVAAGLPHEALRLGHVGEALAAGEELLVGRHRPGLVAHHRAQLGLARHAGAVGQLGGLAGGRDVVIQRQPRAVDHHRAEAQIDRRPDIGQEVDPDADPRRSPGRGPGAAACGRDPATCGIPP